MSKLKDHNPENPKTENLHIRISPEDKKTLVEYADLEGITLSRFIMNLMRRKRIIVCKDHRVWSSILLDIYRRVQNTTELAKKNKNVTPQQITELTDTMKRLEKEVVRYANYIRQPDKKTPDYGKYLKSLREIHESLNELNKHLDKREQKLRQIELHTKG